MKLILDTNVPGKLNLPAYSRDRRRIISNMCGKFRITISPETLIELLDTIQGGDGTHFESDKNLFRLVAGNGSPEFLPFPGSFALSRVLGLESEAAKFGPGDFENWFRVVLNARSRQELFDGNVRIPGGKKENVGVLIPRKSASSRKKE